MRAAGESPPHYVVDPYVAVGAVRFGSTRSDVHRLLGPPDPKFNDPRASLVWYPTIEVWLDGNDLVKQMAFTPGHCVVSIAGHEILGIRAGEPHLDLRRLVLLDPIPRGEAGILVFFKLGLITAGFHDRTLHKPVISAFRRGEFDSLKTAPAWDGT